MAETLPRLALSVRQPWAWAIIEGGKDIENRSRPNRLRGRVCIHAAKTFRREEWEQASWFMHNLGALHPMADDIAFGGIIGTVEIVDCVMASRSPWFAGPHGFLLRDPRPVEFIPVRGELGFFDWRKNLGGRAG